MPVVNRNAAAGNAIADSDLMMGIALGQVPGFKTVNIPGFIPQLSKSDGERMAWGYPGAYTFRTTETLMWVASDNAADVGIPVITTGVNEALTFGVNTAVLNGTTPVPMTIPCMTANTFGVIPSGDLQNLTPNPQGNISLVASNNFSGGVPDNDNEVMNYITQGDGFSKSCLYQVPVGQSAIITSNSVTGTDQVAGFLYINLPGGVPYKIIDLYAGGPEKASSHEVHISIPPIGTIEFFGSLTAIFPEGTFLYMLGEDVSGGPSDIATNLQLIIADTREFGL